YGTAWGIPRGLLAAFGLGPVPATLLHFLGVQGAAMAVVPATTESPPVTEWPRQELAVETFHHLVYATVAGLVFSWLTRSERRSTVPVEERVNPLELGVHLRESFGKRPGGVS